MMIRPLETSDEAAWEAFVEAHPEATLFHRNGWRRVVERAYGYPSHYLMAWDGGQLRGILPLIEVKTALFGHALISTGFFVYGGILATDPQALHALAGAAAELAERLGVDYLELRSRRAALRDTGPDRTEAIAGSYAIRVSNRRVTVWQYRVDIAAPGGQWRFVEALDHDADPKLALEHATLTQPSADGYWVYSTSYDCELDCD